MNEPTSASASPPFSRSEAFETIIDWIRGERSYQATKWDYESEPSERLDQGLDADSWFWQKGILNYTGRVRIFGLDHVLGRQALMKLITTLVNLAELAVVRHGPPPRPGVSSGNQ